MEKIKNAKRSLIFLLVTVIALLVFAACTDKSKVTFRFETNGGDAVQELTVEKGETVTLPQATREGYLFGGWYDNKELKGSAVESVVAEKNMTFYAAWQEAAAVTLDVGDGTLSVTKLSLKQGENLYNAVKDLQPTPNKAGFIFGAWFLDGKELTATATMPKGGVTLTARYKVQYTAEIWRNSLDGSKYEKDAELYTGYEYITGTAISAPVTLDGFVEVAHEGAQRSMTLTENYTQNKFVLYFDRRNYSVVFQTNYPDGTQNTSETRTLPYGSKIEAPDFFTCGDYVLGGWSNTANGAALYKTHPFEKLLGEDAKGDEIEVKGGLMLYAVWLRGYTDVFRGQDRIYVDGEKAYLLRGDNCYAGRYDAAGSSFVFEPAAGPISGRIVENEFFLYQDANRTRSYNLLGGDNIINLRVAIYLDNYNGIVYDNNGARSDGTYLVDENGYFVATFTSGEFKGQTLTIYAIEVQTTAGTTQSVFRVRDAEVISWGNVCRAAIVGPTIDRWYPSLYFVFNGFGGAAYYNGSSMTNYSYVRDGDIITLHATSGSSSQTVIKHVEIDDTHHVFIIAGAARDITEEDGSRLVLDGYADAVYTDKNGTEWHGLYTMTSTQMGNFVHMYLPNNTERGFLVTSETMSEFDEEGNETRRTVYSFAPRLATYNEYAYSAVDANGNPQAYYAPLIAVDETEAGKLTVYGRTSAGRFVPVLYGGYEKDAEFEELYHFTTETHYPYGEEVSTTFYDYSRVVSFTFGTDVLSVSTALGQSAYLVSYWKSVTMTPEEGGQAVTEDFDRQYTQQGGSATLTVIGAFAIYSDGEEVVTGQITTSNNVTRIIPYGQNTGVYVELNEEDGTFVRLEGIIGTLYGLNTDGTVLTRETLVLDGKGNGVYTLEPEETEEGEEAGEPTVYTGQVTLESDTIDVPGSGTEERQRVRIYKFTSTELTFRYIVLSTSSRTVFSRENGTGGEYDSDDNEKLVLDGFNFYASFTDESGEMREGQYRQPEENVVYFTFTEDGTTYAMYFDLREGQEFTVRGAEYGTSLLLDNNGFNGYYLEFDGYGGLKVYKMETVGEESEKVYVDEEGAYTLENGVYRITYREGSEERTLFGMRGTYTESDYVFRAFFIRHEEVESVYVNARDWSVLRLNAYGGATRILANGSEESGNYKIITDDLLYYVNNVADYACLFRYNKQTGDVEEIRYKERGYYTSNLDALRFDKAGFMIEGAETRYYYEVKENGDVILYKQDLLDATANRYGFVSENIGPFGDTLQRDGKEYYENSGYSVTFMREEEGKEKYPVSTDEETGETFSIEELSFTPVSSGVFSTRGSFVCNGNVYSCTVRRTVNEDGTSQLSIVYRTNLIIDINIHYEGDYLEPDVHDTFSVTGLRSLQVFESAAYFNIRYTYLLLGAMLGSPELMQLANTLENNYGTIEIITEYGEDGMVIEGGNYINLTLGSSSGILDEEGNPRVYKRLPFTLDSESAFHCETKVGESTYILRFALTNRFYELFGAYAYELVGYDLVETFEVDGYTVEIERVERSDLYSPGGFYNVIIKQGETAIEPRSIYIDSNKKRIHFIAAHEDDAETADYYFIDYVTEESEEIESTVLKILSVSVEKKTVAYRTNGVDYLYFNETDKEVYLLAAGGSVFLIESTTEEGGVYTVVTTSGRTFTVTFDEEKKPTVTEVVEETPDEEQGE